jgi:membrane protein
VSRLRRLIDRWQRRRASIAFAVAVGRKFGDDRAGGFAALIAYYAFFSIFPLLLALTSVLGFVLQGDEQLQEEIVDSVFAEVPVLGPQIRASIGSVDGSGPALVIGLGLAIWAGLGVTLALSRAFDRVWSVPRVRRRRFVAARVRGLLLLVAIGLTLVASSVATGAAVAGELGSRLESVLTVALSVGVDVIVMALIFLLGTSRHLRLAQVLPRRAALRRRAPRAAGGRRRLRAGHHRAGERDLWAVRGRDRAALLAPADRAALADRRGGQRRARGPAVAALRRWSPDRRR